MRGSGRVFMYPCLTLRAIVMSLSEQRFDMKSYVVKVHVFVIHESSKSKGMNIFFPEKMNDISLVQENNFDTQKAISTFGVSKGNLYLELIEV